MSEAHVRIDEGVKRGPRKQINRTPKASRAGIYNRPHPPGLRETVTSASYELLSQGKTTCEIGELYGVPGPTVRFWLLNDPQADQARLAMINHELARTGEEIRTAEDALTLARGREEARYWMWIAERRESRLYGPKQEITHVSGDLGERLRRARERVIEAEPVADAQHAAVLSPPSDASSGSDSSK